MDIDNVDKVVINRTPAVIAAEINAIKYQTTQIVLSNFIELGRRLTEAKKLLPYGQWSSWLEESVSFSQRKAQELMRLYDAYGTSEPA